MNILVISNYFSPEIGAAPNRIYLMTKGLSEYSKNIEVACPFPNYPTGKILGNYKGLYQKDSYDNIITHRFYIYPDNSESKLKRAFSMLSFAVSLWLIPFKINTANFDKVIIQNSPLLVSFSSIILFKKILKKEIILNISDLWPQSAIDLGFMREGGLSHRIFSKIESINYSLSDKFMGQSNSILNHLIAYPKPKFLYLNVPNKNPIVTNRKKTKILGELRLVYAGLLGVAQNIFNLIEYLEKIELRFVFDIYGDGTEKNKIKRYLNENKIKNIRYLGSLSRDEITQKYADYDFAFSPLITNIKGAFPSKIFELISNVIPIIYIGHGEAYDFVKTNNLGISILPEKINCLEAELKKVTSDDYNAMLFNCQQISKTKLDFNEQINELAIFLKDE